MDTGTDMKIQGPEMPAWLRKLILALPEPGPKGVSTIYGLLIFALLVQILTTVMIAVNSR
jgi:hypothetical protein